MAARSVQRLFWRLNRFRAINVAAVLWTKFRGVQQRQLLSRPRMPAFYLEWRAIIAAIAFSSTKDTKLDRGKPIVQRVKEEEEIKAVIAKADELYNNCLHDEIYKNLIEHKDKENDEILWRLGRAAFDRSKGVISMTEKQQLVNEAMHHVSKALKINPDNFAVHKWMAILIDAVSEYQGSKARITSSLITREHMQKAVELNPHDATSFYLLGMWYYSFADLSWSQRKLASLFFATVPNADFKQALEHFLKAEEVDPNFYSMNLLMIGKAYLKLGDKEKAAAFFHRVAEYKVKTEDDKEAHKEALAFLKKLY